MQRVTSSPRPPQARMIQPMSTRLYPTRQQQEQHFRELIRKRRTISPPYYRIPPPPLGFLEKGNLTLPPPRAIERGDFETTRFNPRPDASPDSSRRAFQLPPISSLTRLAAGSSNLTEADRAQSLWSRSLASDASGASGGGGGGGAGGGGHTNHGTPPASVSGGTQASSTYSMSSDHAWTPPRSKRHRAD